MKKIFFSLLVMFSLLVSIAQFLPAQIYNEDFSKLQKTNVFKQNKVWMAYGWTFLYPKGKQEKKGKKTSFERFDREGNRTEEIYYDNKGNPGFSCQYLYDNKGNQVKKMGGEGDEIIYEQWNYTELDNARLGDGAGQGKKVERKSEFKKSKNEKWVYLFDARHNIIAETYYDISGIMSYKWEFIYDEKQNIIQKTEFDPYGNVFMKWFYTYDEKGNNTEMHHYVSNNQLHRIYQMRYDKKGNVKSKFTLDKNENIIDLTVYVYQFYDGLHAARGVGNKQ